MIRRLHVPLLAPTDIIPHLGAPHHWKEGRSAKSLVDQWWLANDVPRSVRALLDDAPEWAGSTLIDAFVERCTDLRDGRASASQSDLLAVMRLRDGLGVVGIEAKVDKGFDKTVDEWRLSDTPGKRARLEKLCDTLGLPVERAGPLRYQLLHRTVAAIIEAQRYAAHHAATIVQSWSDKADGLADFQRFALATGWGDANVGKLTPALMVGGVSLRLGWSAEVF